MKTKRIQPRKHGLSRLEKLLQDSIRHELAIKALWCYVRLPMAILNANYGFVVACLLSLCSSREWDKSSTDWWITSKKADSSLSRVRRSGDQAKAVDE
jgi:hypothetical protein